MAKRIFILPLVSLAVAGCGQTVLPLNSQAFYHENQSRTVPPVRPVGGQRDFVGPTDEPGRLDPVPATPRPETSVQGISSTVAEGGKPLPPASQPLVWAPPSAVPSTLPTTILGAIEADLQPPTTLPSGQYVVIGIVLADVDGTPVFANKVIEKVEKALSVRARELDNSSFKIFAAGQLKNQRDAEIRNELIYRAAQRSLDENDRKLVDQLTTRWRSDQITRAGGSLELARRAARADGQEFDEIVEEQHRLYMTQVYYEKRVYPLIVVTADMVRDYYNRNLDTVFASKSSATFRMIQFDASEIGSVDLARAKAEEVRKQAAGGAEFAQLAHEYNKDAMLRSHGGYPMDGPIDRGAFGIKPIDEAVWQLQPGQVSPVIAFKDSFYVVKVETRTDGAVRPFESEQVQDQITTTLRRDQFRTLREKEENRVIGNAIVRVDEASMEVALDMVMQNYPAWHAAKK